jgi:hypothetical protein
LRFPAISFEPAGTWRYRLRTIDMDAGSIDRRKIVYRVRAFPSQRRFYESVARYSGFSGPVGSGKTHALVFRALRAAAANPGCTGLLGAPTIPMLRSVTM